MVCEGIPSSSSKVEKKMKEIEPRGDAGGYDDNADKDK